MPTKRTRGRVIVVGSSNTDLVVRCDRLPQAGETVLGGDLETYAGGKGANQAVAAARAGAKVHFIGAFGDDAFGRARRADLEREGIDCSGCVVKKGVPSGVALIGIGAQVKKWRRATAENQILVAPGANARLTAMDVKRALSKLRGTADVLLCSLEIPTDAVCTAIDVARNRGQQTILNPAPFLPERHSRIARRAHVITPNENEFRFLFSSRPGTAEARKTIRFALHPSRKLFHVIATRGSRGVLYYYEFVYGAGKKKFIAMEVPAPVVSAVDSVGAGDCFNGCLAANFADNPCNYIDAIRFAIAAAAIQVTRRGAQAAMPYRHEILKMLKRMKTQ